MFVFFLKTPYNRKQHNYYWRDYALRRPAIDINTKQKQILAYLVRSIKEDYHCPTVREICTEVGLSSTATVQSHLNALEKFGYIVRDTNKNRSIKLVVSKIPQSILSEDISTSVELSTPSANATFEFLGATLRPVPLVGHVQAGLPITAEENRENELPLPVELVGNSDCFLLRVHGASMINMGIYEGDMLIVRNQSTANNGDVVVARIDDEATVKRFFKESDHIRLQPENDDFDPIIVTECVIEGKVIGLIRDRL